MGTSREVHNEEQGKKHDKVWQKMLYRCFPVKKRENNIGSRPAKDLYLYSLRVNLFSLTFTISSDQI